MMAVEMHDGGGMSITGDDIYRFRWVTVKHALQLEVHTGMTMSRQGSVLPIAKQIVEGFGVVGVSGSSHCSIVVA